MRSIPSVELRPNWSKEITRTIAKPLVAESLMHESGGKPLLWLRFQQIEGFPKNLAATFKAWQTWLSVAYFPSKQT